MKMDTGCLEPEDKRDLRVNLKPLFRVMKLCGLFHTPSGITQTTVQDLTKKKMVEVAKLRDVCSNNITKAYSIFLLVFVWFMVAKSALALFWKYGESELKLQLSTNSAVVVGYNLQAALEVCVLFRMFHKKDRYHKFLVDWYDFAIEAAACGCPQDELARKLRKSFMRYFVFYVMIYVFLQGGLFGALFGPDGATKESMIMLVDPFPRTEFWYIVTSISVTFVESPWLCTILLFIATSKALALQFKTLTVGLDIAIFSSPNSCPPDLPALRLAHIKLCDFVALIERDFKLILAIAYCLNILISLFLGYTMVKDDFDTGTFLIRGFWLVCNVSKVYVLSLCASQLHETAKEPLVALFKVNPTGITLDQAKNLDLFILKLQGTNIGFTVWDFMLVTRETILTLMGVFLTYFFVVVQFNFPSNV